LKNEKGVLAEFECVFIKGSLKGASFSEFTPLKELTKTTTLIDEETKGKPKWSKFEGKEEAKLTVSIGEGAPEEAGVEAKFTVEPEDAVYIAG
jgi:hypothetical protein